MARLSLSLLGTFQATLDGRPVTAFASDKVRALLAYLAVEADRPHRREALAGLLWPDWPDASAQTNLRNALSNLRKAIGDREAAAPVILADRETIQFNSTGEAWADVHAFRALTDPHQAVDGLERGSALYRGPLLEGFCLKDSAPFEEWLQVAREQLQRQYLAALARLAEHHERRGDLDRACEVAWKQVDLAPWQEEAHRQLMRLLALSGQRGAALAQYETCCRVLQAELGVEPVPETVALYERIRDDTFPEQIRVQAPGAPLPPASPATQPRHNLPTPLSSFIGREKEIVQVKQLLTGTNWGTVGVIPPRRLVTLTGAGGVGKTRLALQVGREMLSFYPDGVWWVELAPLADPALVPQAVVQVFGLRPEAGRSPQVVLADYFREKKALLVLDNCEHLLDACAQLAEILLTACPELQILATSREALGLTGEVTWCVPSLESPDPQHLPPPENLTQYDAICLLVERTQAVAPHWQLAGHAEAAARICWRLDGIPLAIELAAARLKVLSAEQLVERLDDRFQLLTGGSRTALPRHRTLRATIDWSYNLLSGVESAFLRRLAVFAGGWALAAAEAVAGVDPISPGAVLDLLTALVDKSLVVVEPERCETRYKLLESVRQYAHEKLLEVNEVEIYSRRHWEWFLQLAEQAEPKLRSGEQLEWGEKLERDMENLRAALRWSLAQTDERDDPAQRLAGRLARFWYVRGYWDEGLTWLEQSLESCTITPARARALMGLATLRVASGMREKCRALWEESLALYRQQGDQWGIAFTAVFCGKESSDPKRASALFKEAHSIAQELNDEWLAAATHNIHGLYALQQGDLALAGSLFQSVLDHARHSGDVTMIDNGLANSGAVACEQGDYDRAAALFEQALSFARSSNKPRLVQGLDRLGELARLQGDYVRAAAAYTEALQLSREIKDVYRQALMLCNLGYVALHEHDYVRARALFEECLPLQHRLESIRGFLLIVAGLAGIVEANGKPQQAARLLGAVQASFQALAPDLKAADRMEYDHILAAARAELDQTTFNAAWEEGRKMTLEQAIEYALKET